MRIEVRTPTGKKLFEWNPQKQTITIVSKQHRYCVELQDDGNKPEYKVSEQLKKQQDATSELLDGQKDAMREHSILLAFFIHR